MLLARRNLFRDRTRFLLSVLGVAVSIGLILLLAGYRSGVYRQASAYLDNTPGSVVVAERGIRDFLGTSSVLPPNARDAVAATPGVARDAPMGGPWDVVEGSSRVGRGEVIVDRGFARKAGATLGDRVTVLGGEATIVGLSEGTASLVNSVAFLPFGDFRAMRSGAPVVSFVLVRTTQGASADGVAAAIERRVSGVTAQSREAFAAGERRLVTDMSAEVISIMNVIGFVVGLAVVALTLYIATLARRREYGVLKALGARNRVLYRVVLVQAGLSVVIGFVIGLAFTGLLGLLVARTDLNLELAITAASLVKVGLFAAVIAGLAAILPIRQVAGLDPAIVFRRGAAT